jgi:parallel beta-helix repeat protein
VVADWYVDAVVGADTNAGTFQAPFKSITHALSVVAASQTIYAAPGVYDVANGEVFPLDIPADVILLGDEANKGDAAAPTFIRGGAMVPPPYASIFSCSVLPRSGVVIAGFRIYNDVAADPTTFPYGLVMPDSNVTLRNNTIRDSAKGGLYIFNGTGHTLSDNAILNHGGAGIGFIGGGADSRVEGNLITGNLYGVEYDSAGGDLGGGATGSAGGNTISCNTLNDIWTNIPSLTIDAQNNFWDHNPPSTGSQNGGIDLRTDVMGGAPNYITTGAALATAPCP